jgi:hypothetical protein
MGSLGKGENCSLFQPYRSGDPVQITGPPHSLACGIPHIAFQARSVSPPNPVVLEIAAVISAEIIVLIRVLVINGVSTFCWFCSSVDNVAAYVVESATKLENTPRLRQA